MKEGGGGGRLTAVGGKGEYLGGSGGEGWQWWGWRTRVTMMIDFVMGGEVLLR